MNENELNKVEETGALTDLTVENEDDLKGGLKEGREHLILPNANTYTGRRPYSKEF